MAESKLPYVFATGNITKVLEKIRAAQTPPRFTQDFLATTLDMPGGTAKPLLPFLKRTGFLATDGAPTDLYRRFRNPGETGAAAAQALRTGYKALYEINEYAHDLKDAGLRGLVLQATGADGESRTVTAIVGSFKALKGFADFSAAPADNAGAAAKEPSSETPPREGGGLPQGISLGYTINLHLPATSDVAVFDAIFKSLREHILR